MVTYRNVNEIREKLPNAVAAIGNFDGVHLGHREIFRRVREEAAALGGVSVVITFIPHPLKVLRVGKELHLITTYAEKEALIAAAGLDYLIVIPFTQEFAAISARDFVREVLVDAVGVRKLVIGYDYAFGRNREGNVQLLSQLGTEYGFGVEILPPCGNRTMVYSSSAIRRMIAAGDVRGVAPLLGRYYSLAGRVVHGQHRGKGLGFPTANIATDKDLLPPAGVYAVKVMLEGGIIDGACNIGTNPTFGDAGTSIEAFLFDFDGDLYGLELRLYFIDRIRDERRFPDIDALIEAIAADVARCRAILGPVGPDELCEFGKPAEAR
jgi:riboflavin kinase / FMN adenylyltransferase